jgi:CAAX amino terminal protease family.
MKENKENKRKRHPILFSCILGISLTALVAIASIIVVRMKLMDAGIVAAQACAYFVMAVILTIYMGKHEGSFGKFGFKKRNIFKEKGTLMYIPLLIIIAVQPVIGGFNLTLTIQEVILILVFSFLVGYTEESIFRGIIRERLRNKGVLFYVLFSSLFFGVLHMANAFNGSSFQHILIQIINALLVGLVLALLIETADNILPLILFHFMFDAFAQLANHMNSKEELLAVSILNIFYFLYGACMIFVLLNRRRIKQRNIGRAVL